MGKKDGSALPPLAPSASAKACADPAWRAHLADEAAHGLSRRMPSLSAHRVVVPAQAAALIALAAIAVTLGIAWPDAAWRALVALTSGAFLRYVGATTTRYSDGASLTLQHGRDTHSHHA